jgi:hypothetical protein
MSSSEYPTIVDRLDTVFSKQLFFVCGVLKSGTTWLERILDAHPQCVCKGEAHFGSDLIRPLAELLENYNKSVANKGGAIAQLKEHGGATSVLSYDDQDLSFLSTAAIGLMYGKWLTDADTVSIGDKTPRNLEDMEKLSTLFPGARFVHIIRDGRDVAVSLWHFNLRTNIGATIQQWGTFDNFCKEFAEIWSKRVSNGRQRGQSLSGGRYFELRYEDLLQDPDTVLPELFNFLDLTHDTNTVTSCIEACSFEQLSGGRHSGQEDHQSFYRKGISGDWKNHIKGKNRETFEHRAGDMLSELGYLSIA